MGKGYLRFCAVLVGFVMTAGVIYPIPSLAAVIFSDDFDAVSSTWTCADATPSGWAYHNPACQSSSFGGVTHATSEISPGGRTGNSLKIWRRAGFPTERDYFSNLLYGNPFSVFPPGHRTLYTRWTMKIPAEWEELDFGYRKLWRMGATASGDTLYINFNCRRDDVEYWVDSRWSNCSSLMVYPSAGGDGWYTLLPFADLPRDGVWHSYEIGTRLDTTGNNDGMLRFWLDGVEHTICRNDFSRDYDCSLGKTTVDYGAATGDEWLSTAVGIGNRGDPEGQQSSWQAIEFDDYALGDGYIGPVLETPDTTPPAAPTGLGVQ
jgi:hypothetical protein